MKKKYIYIHIFKYQDWITKIQSWKGCEMFVYIYNCKILVDSWRAGKSLWLCLVLTCFYLNTKKKHAFTSECSLLVPTRISEWVNLRQTLSQDVSRLILRKSEFVLVALLQFVSTAYFFDYGGNSEYEEFCDKQWCRWGRPIEQRMELIETVCIDSLCLF